MIDLQSVYRIAEKKERESLHGPNERQFWLRFAASTARADRGLDPDGFWLEVKETIFKAARIGDEYAIKAIPISEGISPHVKPLDTRPKLREMPEHEYWGEKGGESHAFVLDLSDAFPEPGDRAACGHAFDAEYVKDGTKGGPKKQCAKCVAELA